MHKPVNELDIERTLQATERTFLAYLRTSVNLFAVGVSLIKFFETLVLSIIGWFLVPISLIIFLVGFHHYKDLVNHLKKIVETKQNNY